MKGYELIKEIQDRKLKAGTKIKVKIKDEYKTTIIYENAGLKWKTGEFDTSILCSENAEFELIEENKEIGELKTECATTFIETEIINKLNELIKDRNKLIKESEEK